MANNILALDQATRTTGFSVYSKDTGELINYGAFTFDSSDFDTRLYHIYRKVKDLIGEYSITEVFLEDIQLQDNIANNVQTFKKLAEVLGVLSCLCVELNIPHTIVHSNTWKSFLKIEGKQRSLQKKNAQLFVLNKYGISVSEDTADAICIGQYAINSQNPNDWTR